MTLVKTISLKVFLSVPHRLIKNTCMKMSKDTKSLCFVELQQ